MYSMMDLLRNSAAKQAAGPEPGDFKSLMRRSASEGKSRPESRPLIHLGTRPLETERLLLRPFVLEDVPDVLRNWASDPLVQAGYFEQVCETEDEVASLLKRYMAGYIHDDYYRWAVTLKETGEGLGQIGIFLVDTARNFGELEYCISRRFQNRGLATEAALAVIKFALEEVRFHRLQICHRENNQSSKRVIEKCGFVYEGTLREFYHFDDHYDDRLYYSIVGK